MAILRTADFVAEGRTDAQASLARGALVATRYPREAKSWQAKAYWSGFDEEISRLQNSKVLTENPDFAESTDGWRSPSFEGWPKAAVEHAKRLADDWHKESKLPRRVRLEKALHRMWKRYAQPAC